jgi:hypothetical protein
LTDYIHPMNSVNHWKPATCISVIYNLLNVRTGMKAYTDFKTGHMNPAKTTA